MKLRLRFTKDETFPYHDLGIGVDEEGIFYIIPDVKYFEMVEQ